MGALRGKPPNALRAKGVEKEEEEGNAEYIVSTQLSNLNIWLLKPVIAAVEF
jgi:hypothetical protein